MSSFGDPDNLMEIWWMRTSGL
jgi:hypothetical protein